MQLRPTILKELSEENNIPLQPMDCYADESDELYLEDEVQRIILVGNVRASDYVTGIFLSYKYTADLDIILTRNNNRDNWEGKRGGPWKILRRRGI